MNIGINLYNKIKEIENAAPQRIRSKTENTAFGLRPDKWLLNDLSGNYGAFFIRAILQQLEIDESFVLKWRLENKFQQYQILTYYAPYCMPSTLPLSIVLNEKDGIKKIRDLFSQGFFLKSTLGDNSYNTQSWDKTGEFEQIAVLPSVCTEQYENYMLQKKICIKTEFRVHTFSKDIIPGLSYVSHGENQTNYHQDLEGFLNDIIKKIPGSILSGTLIAWDIAFTPDNHYYIIEANFTGFHPEYRRGFQTTGYVDDYKYGPIICAWLNLYFKKKFRICIDAIEDSLFLNYPFYRAMAYYMSILKNEHFDLLENNRQKNAMPIILYLAYDTNMLVVYLIKHFLLVDFAKNIFVIVRDEYFLKMKDILGAHLQIQVLVESYLFTKDQYELIKQLGYDRRKQICCYHALRKLKDKLCVII